LGFERSLTAAGAGDSGREEIAVTDKNRDWQTTKRGYNFYEVLSAFQKAVRRGDGKLAGYGALELYDSGFESHVWNRLRIIACEDIAEPITREIEALKQSHDFVNKGKKKDEPKKPGRLMVAKATLLLAAAKKCRDADHLICLGYEDNTILAETLLADLEAAKDDAKKEIPGYALDMHTLRGGKMGRNDPKEFLKAEFQALKPRVPGIFDEELQSDGQAVEPGHRSSDPQSQRVDMRSNPLRDGHCCPVHFPIQF
jgi:replication-associated recombination protein RarA